MAHETHQGRPRVLIRPLPIILGALAGAGIAVLLQQYGVTPLTLPFLLSAVAIGAVVLGALPTILVHVLRPAGGQQGGDRP